MKQGSLILAIILLIAGETFAQKNYPTTTINDRKTISNGPFFQLQIEPDSQSPAFSVQIVNPEKKKLQLTISHEFAGIAVDTTIYSDQFNSKYLMNNAEDGKYIIELSNGKEKIKKEIFLNTVTTRKLVVSE